MKFSIYLAIGFLFVLIPVFKSYADVVPVDSDRWEIQASENRVTDYLGRRSLYLREGIASVKNTQFTDGIIEFNMAFTGDRGFLGAVWRMKDFKNYEEFFIRSHHSGNPDAIQYETVLNGRESWQLYPGEGYEAAPAFDYNQWVHFKVVVAGRSAEIYIKDMQTPALFVSDLRGESNAGGIGLSASLAPAYFSNFSFTKIDNPPLKGKSKTRETPPPGTVISWMVSDAFDEKSLENKYQITETDRQKTRWQKLNCDNTGLANLARLHGTQEGKDTVFSRVIIYSDKEQVRKLRFGFSDDVKIYFNGRLLYAGSDIQKSRDYLFLGTLGLYDELYLPLKKGENELWMAVTENFGGWGIRAVFDDIQGISFKK